jgi:hypothetical protein
MDMVGGTGVSEVRVDAQIDTRVGKADSCPYDTIFESLGFMIPLLAAVCDGPLHCQNSVVFVH